MTEVLCQGWNAHQGTPRLHHFVSWFSDSHSFCQQCQSVLLHMRQDMQHCCRLACHPLCRLVHIYTCVQRFAKNSSPTSNPQKLALPRPLQYLNANLALLEFRLRIGPRLTARLMRILKTMLLLSAQVPADLGCRVYTHVKGVTS